MPTVSFGNIMIHFVDNDILTKTRVIRNQIPITLSKLLNRYNEIILNLKDFPDNSHIQCARIMSRHVQIGMPQLFRDALD